MGFDDAQYDNEPVDKTEYEAYEARKERASAILKQIASANSGEDAIQPIMEILDEAGKCKAEEQMKFAARDATIAAQNELKAANLQVGELREENDQMRCVLQQTQTLADRRAGCIDAAIKTDAEREGHRQHLERLNGEMLELLTQFRDSEHLFRHNSSVPVERCSKPPCQKVMKFIEKPFREPKTRDIHGMLPDEERCASRYGAYQCSREKDHCGCHIWYPNPERIEWDSDDETPKTEKRFCAPKTKDILGSLPDFPAPVCDQRMLASANPIYCTKEKGHAGEHMDGVGIHWI